MKQSTILLFGAPGAGKGTQGKILGGIPNYLHVASGDLFRNLRTESPLGKVFLEYSSKGELVPDEPTVQLWREDFESRIRNGEFNPETDTLVLDGIPRNVGQAEMLRDSLDVIAVVNLFCTNLEKMVERLQARALRENRLDDANIDTIRNRLVVYEKQTKPLLDFYGASLVHTVDSTQSPVHVLMDVLSIIADL